MPEGGAGDVKEQRSRSRGGLRGDEPGTTGLLRDEETDP
jgi:hypothetical protein